MVRVVGQGCPALGTARAVGRHNGLNGRGGHHCVPEDGLEVDQVADELVLLSGIAGGRTRVLTGHLSVVGGSVGVGEQLLEGGRLGDVTGSRHRTQAPNAGVDGPADQDAFGHRLGRTASATGEPAGTAMTSVPSPSASSTRRDDVTMDPGCRLSSRVSNTSGLGIEASHGSGDEGQVGPATLRTQTDVQDYRRRNQGPKLPR